MFIHALIQNLCIAVLVICKLICFSFDFHCEVEYVCVFSYCRRRFRHCRMVRL